MSVYEEVLGFVNRGIEIRDIAEQLAMRPDAVKAIIESQVRAGHLQDLDCAGSACDTCPMSKGCPVPQDGPSQYVITIDGKKLLQASGNDGEPAPYPVTPSI
ncbi:FeoC-like transcriptional regulator [Halodesulfurarchaeum sp. HSR-GB]|uniref:FeoC-like transcriptional regulator n=1 Tax=Halodesulfurarchaeum sp. HSR-GB TaxID=3074077 RepID=UPI0037C004DD